MQDILQLWPETLLFERKTLADIPDVYYQALISKVFMPGDLGLRVENVTATLCTLYNARRDEPARFLEGVFLRSRTPSREPALPFPLRLTPAPTSMPAASPPTPAGKSPSTAAWISFNGSILPSSLRRPMFKRPD
jgi:hypothetical protein